MDSIAQYIVSLAAEVSGSENAHLDSYVYRDLLIGRGDALEFYDCIERKFGIDLRPITEDTVEVRSGLLLRTRKRIIAKDIRLNDIVNFVKEAT